MRSQLSTQDRQLQEVPTRCLHPRDYLGTKPLCALSRVGESFVYELVSSKGLDRSIACALPPAPCLPPCRGEVTAAHAAAIEQLRLAQAQMQATQSANLETRVAGQGGSAGRGFRNVPQQAEHCRSRVRAVVPQYIRSQNLAFRRPRV